MFCLRWRQWSVHVTGKHNYGIAAQASARMHATQPQQSRGQSSISTSLCNYTDGGQRRGGLTKMLRNGCGLESQNWLAEPGKISSLLSRNAFEPSLADIHHLGTVRCLRSKLDGGSTQRCAHGRWCFNLGDAQFLLGLGLFVQLQSPGIDGTVAHLQRSSFRHRCVERRPAVAHPVAPSTLPLPVGTDGAWNPRRCGPSVHPSQ